MKLSLLSKQLLLIRGSLFALQIITTSVISPYDTSARDAQKSSKLPLDWLASFGHGNWDAVYFNYLARYGYDYEQFAAFFPLYPAVLSAITNVFYLLLHYVMSYDACLVFTSCILSNSIFIINSMFIYKLSKLVGLTDAQAHKSSLLYALNPANIFMSVGYTESLFSFFVLLGLIIREADSQWYFLFFSLATGVRSNGITLVFFILYDHITFMIKSGQVLLVNIVCMVIQVCATVAPFFWFQNHLSDLYCSEDPQFTDWCESGMSYHYIQSKYWGVGFFKYWETKQIPNFLLASPMFILIAYVALTWLYDHYRNQSFSELRTTFAIFSFHTAGYLHLIGLAAVALVTMHVQVVTRFIVANCPYLFIYCTKLTGLPSRLVLIYFVVYSVVGTVVHSTFYPWT